MNLIIRLLSKVLIKVLISIANRKRFSIIRFSIEKLHNHLISLPLAHSEIKPGIDLRIFSIFTPASAGRKDIIDDLTILSINQTIPLLEHLIRDINGFKQPKIYSIDEFFSKLKYKKNKLYSDELSSKFNLHKSDKSATNNYHLIYASLFKEKVKVKGLLEIGLGTHDYNIASHMSKHEYQPGASLMAFRDFFSTAMIYGADIDKKILFKEQRIRTYYVDQTDLSSFENLSKNLKNKKIDLIIDDGLHAPNANITTFIFALSILKKGGWFVVEDIKEEAVVIWELASHIIPKDLYKCFIVKTQASVMFLCNKTE